MKTCDSSTFKYKPLVKTAHVHPIRLLALLPAKNFNSDIRCEVIHTSLEVKPEFEALSYTWGNTKHVVPLFIHDQTHYVTKNLDSALRHLRYAQMARVLWVDALCINQSDIPERNQQVSQMREIYNTGGARRVVVWLGEAKSAKLALEFCKTLSTEEPAFATLPGYDLEWEACHELFFDRPWWSRAWIIQEVVHTNEVIVCIGDLEPKSIEDICDAFATYTYLLGTRNRLQAHAPHVRGLQKSVVNEGFPARLPQSKQLGKSIAPLGRDWNSWIRAEGHLMDTALEIQGLRSDAKGSSLNDLSRYPPNLPALIMRFRNHDTTDFRDKIYAFLGLAFQGPIWHDIPVDYNLSKRSFYTIVARAFIKRALIPLLLVESHHRPVLRDHDLPSWVSDYTIKQGFVPRSYISTAPSFYADKGFPSVSQEPRFLDPPDCEVLVLRGIYVAVITGVFETRITQDEDIRELDRLKLLRYDEDPQVRYRDFIQDPPPPWQTEDPENGTPLISHSNTSWGPIFAEHSDIIIVAAGSRIPLVLRKFEEGKYLFVGACWMVESEIQNITMIEEDPGFSSIMFGRACEGLPDDYEAELFCIY